jgi:hypothetical protein
MSAPVTDCERCGVSLRASGDRNPSARVLRRSLTTGVCAGCALTAFLKETEPLASVLAARGPEMLLMSHVQEQVARMLEAGDADARPSELDYAAVVRNWNLPEAGTS